MSMENCPETPMCLPLQLLQIWLVPNLCKILLRSKHQVDFLCTTLSKPITLLPSKGNNCLEFGVSVSCTYMFFKNNLTTFASILEGIHIIDICIIVKWHCAFRYHSALFCFCDFSCWYSKLQWIPNYSLVFHSIWTYYIATLASVNRVIYIFLKICCYK